MSFGRPPGFTTFSVTPPDRGSFPLDHEGECKSVMQEYMACLKRNKQDNGQCRHLSRRYLECRMEKFVMCCEEKGLMEKDEMKNLGFQDDEELKHQSAAVIAERAIPKKSSEESDTASASPKGASSLWSAHSSAPSRSTQAQRI